ncbi:hypothetical protein IWX49DRAFT_625669 [Phyllosticta citricarpa]
MLVSGLGPRKLVLFVFFVICCLFILLRNSFENNLTDRVAAIPESWSSRLGNQQEHLSSEKPSPAQDVAADKQPAKEETSQPQYSFPAESQPKTSTSTSSTASTSATSSSETRPNSTSNSWHAFDAIKGSSDAPIARARKPSPISNLKQYISKMIVWARPGPDPSHWPAYQDYVDRDYDPNRWEAFPAERGYYTEGVKTLKAKKQKPYLPYPDYNGPEWSKQWKGEYVACEGPRGKLLNESRLDLVTAYPDISPNFPKPSIGSIEALGLDANVCFDRYGRYGAYGFGADEYDLPDWEPVQEQQVIWRHINWGKLQNQCVVRNHERFAPEARTTETNLTPGMDIPETPTDTEPPKGSIDYTELSRRESGEVVQKYHPRTAILIRTWEGYTYTDNDLQAIRAMIQETSLWSGGEYQVFLFVNVKDRSVPIFDDQNAYQDMLKKVVPTELRSISILWNEDICQRAYPEVTDWQVYWHQFMPVQWFSKTHPEFDYVWNWETDARYTGQHYHFLHRVQEFAKKQPRKYLWERNKRYYVPQLHGDWETFFNDTNQAVEDAWSEGAVGSPVWGPMPYAPVQTPLGPMPPHEMTSDDYEWGVGEEADLITLLPMFDPVRTFWSYRDKIWNYLDGLHPDFSVDPYDNGFSDPRFVTIPRRIFINTVARFSRRLLHTMHMENKVGRDMQAEMWPASVSLQHGYKAVYAPQPVWFDRIWPPHYVDAIFNANTDGEYAPIGWSEGPDSPYNGDREHNYYGWSWYFSSRFPKDIYRRWLGWKVKVHEWGEPERIVGGQEEEKGMGDRVQVGGSDNRDTEKPVVGGRMCLPGMLLHPVKRIQQGEI